jgi:cell division septation protein DedD
MGFVMEKNTKAKKDAGSGLMKDGRSRRKRAGQAGRGNGTPRIMILAGVVIVAGAIWLYYDPSDTDPTGLGEQHTVVTSELDAMAPANGAAPGSGDVDIEEQTVALTPEEPDDGSTVPAEEEAVVEAPPKVVEATPPPAEEKPAAKPKPPEPRIVPAASGQYAVQIGSFGNAENADKEVTRLKALGWEPRIRAGNNSNGQMVFRVWIAFFPTRQVAQSFINQNTKHISGAIPVHR